MKKYSFYFSHKRPYLVNLYPLYVNDLHYTQKKTHHSFSFVFCFDIQLLRTRSNTNQDVPTWSWYFTLHFIPYSLIFLSPINNISSKLMKNNMKWRPLYPTSTDILHQSFCINKVDTYSDKLLLQTNGLPYQSCCFTLHCQ